MNEIQAYKHAQYEKMKAQGAWCGSVKDSSWDRKAKMHKCCKSKHARYHKSACPLRSDDLSDLK